MKVIKNLMKNVLLVLTLVLYIQSNAQLPDGSVAPDFTLEDIVDTNSYNLYSYLNQGKTVFIEIFAAHCPSCWAYHEANIMKDLYNAYGPDGTDEVMVFALEYDQYNFYEHFIGIGDPWNTAGNWLEGTPYPIFDVEGADRSVFTDYDVQFYPLIFKVCPNKLTERMSTSLSVSELYQKVQECPPLSVEEQILDGKVYINQSSKSLVIENYSDVNSVDVVNLQGQTVLSLSEMENGIVSLNYLNSGVYLFQLNTNRGVVTKKMIVE